uniref:N-acetylglucosaminylphosphatidylinositol deacetylase n=1 Tax=Trypanosoma congolense (strain IL3000) TaxID=1068625 RepID=G0V2A3_TRYCI|nr:unnamed protein product [Trypanosoma congolense IL3000]
MYIHDPMVYGLITLLLAFLVQWHRKSSAEKLPVRGEVLFVFAHPDDEAMFFSPLLRYVKRHNIPTHFLCLSNGNYSGLGAVREGELINSAHYFGVASSNVRIVNHAELQDGLDNVWNTEVIRREVLSCLQGSSAIQTVVTFDGKGVSSHPNHIAVYEGVRAAVKSAPPGTVFYTLYSRNLLEKYSGVLSVLSFLLRGRRCSVCRGFTAIISPTSVFTSFGAMRKHKSQLVWYRYLFLCFSSYSYINEMNEIIVL